MSFTANFMDRKNSVHRIPRKAVTLTAFLIYTAVQAAFVSPGYAGYANLPVSFSESASFAEFPETLSGGFSFVDDKSGLRIDELSDIYVITKPGDPDFLQVSERLPEGGFGRLLRYRGWMENSDNRKWVDLEFVYQDLENNLTILDYEAGRFYRVAFKEKNEFLVSFFPGQDKNWLGDLVASSPFSSKQILFDKADSSKISPMIRRLYSQPEFLSGTEIWSQQKVRGPPAGGLAL